MKYIVYNAYQNMFSRNKFMKHQKGNIKQYHDSITCQINIVIVFSF